MKKKNAGVRGEELRRKARVFFHSPAVRFCAGKSLRCIGSKGSNEKEECGAARRKNAKKSAPFFFTHLLCAFQLGRACAI